MTAVISIIVVMIVAGVAVYFVSTTAGTVTTTTTITTTTTPPTTTTTSSTTPTTTTTSSSSTSAMDSLIAAAKAEGHLTIIDTETPTVMASEIANFTKLYPFITVTETRYDYGPIYSLISAALQAKSSGYDLVEESETTWTQLAVEGAFQPYVNNISGLLDPNYNVSQWSYQDVGLTYTMQPLALLYNTQLVPPNLVPHNYTVMMSPAWQDSFKSAGLSMVLFPSTNTNLVSWLQGYRQYYGNDSYVSFLNALESLHPTLSSSGGPAVTSAIGLGTNAMGITWLSQYVSIGQYYNYPMAIAPISPVWTYRALAGIYKYAADPAAAMLWVQWLLSNAGQQVEASYGEVTPLPVGSSPYTGVNIIPWPVLTPDELTSNATFVSSILK